MKTGLLYAGKGGTVNPSYVDTKGNSIYSYDEYKLHYLEVPLSFIGHLPVGDNGSSMFLGAGPYFALGLNGTNKQTLNNDPIVHRITYGKNGDFKSFDMGSTITLGYQEWSGFLISGNFDLGLINAIENNNSGFEMTKLRTAAFYISVGYMFN